MEKSRANGKKPPVNAPENRANPESGGHMMQRLKADWEAKQYEAEFRSVLEEWACDPGCCLSGRLKAVIPECTTAILFRLLKIYPELRALYDEGVQVRMDCAKLSYIESANGVNELEAGRAIQCQFLIRGYDKEFIRRVENTGKDGGPMKIEWACGNRESSQ